MVLGVKETLENNLRATSGGLNVGVVVGLVERLDTGRHDEVTSSAVHQLADALPVLLDTTRHQLRGYATHSLLVP